MYRLLSSFQLDGVPWRYGNPVDCELDLVDGVSATGEKYELAFFSVGDMLPPDPENCVWTERLGSGTGKRGGRPPVERGGPELPLPPVADRVRRLVLEALRLIGNSEKKAASLVACSSASYSCW